MLKKLLSLGATVLVLAGVVLSGQKAEKSVYPFKMDNTVAKAVFAGKTYDEVWEATLKALIATDYKTTTLEKDAGIIKAVSSKGIVYLRDKPVVKSELPPSQGGTVMATKAAFSKIAVTVESREDKVAVSLRWDRAEKFTLPPTESNGHDIFSALYDKIAELLYGAVESR